MKPVLQNADSGGPRLTTLCERQPKGETMNEQQKKRAQAQAGEE